MEDRPVPSSEEKPENDNCEIEINSGVEFPGQSLEPLLNSALRLDKLQINQNCGVVIEFRESKDKPFSFKYKKGETYIIGECEFCSNRNILKVVCKCKNVKYCNDLCLERDKPYHLPKCSAMADSEL